MHNSAAKQPSTSVPGKFAALIINSGEAINDSTRSGIKSLLSQSYLTGHQAA